VVNDVRIFAQQVK